MNRIGLFLGALALASCSPSEPPPAAVAPRKPAAVPVPAPAPQVQVTPLPMPPQPKTEEEPAKSAPRSSGLSGKIHLPAFTFRFLGGASDVQINGESLGRGTILWAVTDEMEFDPKIGVETWPPEDARKIGTSSHPETGSAEVWLDQSESVARRFPHLRPGETVLYVDGTVGGKKVRGGLRLFVERGKQVFYTPLVDPEGEEASRYLRTIWFDRKFNE